MPNPPRWLPRVVELVLLLVLLVLAGRLALRAFMPDVPVVSPVPSGASLAGPSAIPAVDLFYRRPGDATAGTGSGADLVLHGVRGGDRPSAILAGDDGVQRAWTVGSEPARGLVLEAVGASHAVLRRAGGTTVQLDLAARGAIAAPPTGQATPRRAAGVAVPSGAAAATTSTPPAAAPAASAPTSAAEPSGYQLGEEAGRMPLRLAGLKPGDEILSINGQAVGGDPAALRARLAGQTRFELRYRRDGRTHTATVGLP